jgi:carbamate kinase
MIYLTGNTFAHKDQIRAAGGKWDAVMKAWKIMVDTLPVELAGVATQQNGIQVGHVGGTSVLYTRSYTHARARVRRAWKPCGYPGCSPAHCDECM